MLMKINEPPSEQLSFLPFIIPKYDDNSDSYQYLVDFKLLEFEVLLSSINWRILTPFSCGQVETITIYLTVTESVIIGITFDH
jgi:hypothetical protein